MAKCEGSTAIKINFEMKKWLLCARKCRRNKLKAKLKDDLRKLKLSRKLIRRSLIQLMTQSYVVLDKQLANSHRRTQQASFPSIEKPQSPLPPSSSLSEHHHPGPASFLKQVGDREGDVEKKRSEKAQELDMEKKLDSRLSVNTRVLSSSVLANDNKTCARKEPESSLSEETAPDEAAARSERSKEPGYTCPPSTSRSLNTSVRDHEFSDPPRKFNNLSDGTANPRYEKTFPEAGNDNDANVNRITGEAPRRHSTIPRVDLEFHTKQCTEGDQQKNSQPTEEQNMDCKVGDKRRQSTTDVTLPEKIKKKASVGATWTIGNTEVPNNRTSTHDELTEDEWVSENDTWKTWKTQNRKKRRYFQRSTRCVGSLSVRKKRKETGRKIHNILRNIFGENITKSESEAEQALLRLKFLKEQTVEPCSADVEDALGDKESTYKRIVVHSSTDDSRSDVTNATKPTGMADRVSKDKRDDKVTEIVGKSKTLESCEDNFSIDKVASGRESSSSRTGLSNTTPKKLASDVVDEENNNDRGTEDSVSIKEAIATKDASTMTVGCDAPPTNPNSESFQEARGIFNEDSSANQPSVKADNSRSLMNDTPDASYEFELSIQIPSKAGFTSEMVSLKVPRSISSRCNVDDLKSGLRHVISKTLHGIVTSAEEGSIKNVIAPRETSGANMTSTPNIVETLNTQRVAPDSNHNTQNSIFRSSLEENPRDVARSNSDRRSVTKLGNDDEERDSRSAGQKSAKTTLASAEDNARSADPVSSVAPVSEKLENSSTEAAFSRKPEPPLSASAAVSVASMPASSTTVSSASTPVKSYMQPDIISAEKEIQLLVTISKCIEILRICSYNGATNDIQRRQQLIKQYSMALRRFVGCVIGLGNLLMGLNTITYTIVEYIVYKLNYGLLQNCPATSDELRKHVETYIKLQNNKTTNFMSILFASKKLANVGLKKTEGTVDAKRPDQETQPDTKKPKLGSEDASKPQQGAIDTSLYQPSNNTVNVQVPQPKSTTNRHLQQFLTYEASRSSPQSDSTSINTSQQPISVSKNNTVHVQQQPTTEIVEQLQTSPYKIQRFSPNPNNTKLTQKQAPAMVNVAQQQFLADTSNTKLNPAMKSIDQQQFPANITNIMQQPILMALENTPQSTANTNNTQRVLQPKPQTVTIEQQQLLSGANVTSCKWQSYPLITSILQQPLTRTGNIPHAQQLNPTTADISQRQFLYNVNNIPCVPQPGLITANVEQRQLDANMSALQSQNILVEDTKRQRSRAKTNVVPQQPSQETKKSMRFQDTTNVLNTATANNYCVGLQHEPQVMPQRTIDASAVPVMNAQQHQQANLQQRKLPRSYYQTQLSYLEQQQQISIQPRQISHEQQYALQQYQQFCLQQKLQSYLQQKQQSYFQQPAMYEIRQEKNVQQPHVHSNIVWVPPAADPNTFNTVQPSAHNKTTTSLSASTAVNTTGSTNTFVTPKKQGKLPKNSYLQQPRLQLPPYPTQHPRSSVTNTIRPQQANQNWQSHFVVQNNSTNFINVATLNAAQQSTQNNPWQHTYLNSHQHGAFVTNTTLPNSSSSVPNTQKFTARSDGRTKKPRPTYASTTATNSRPNFVYQKVSGNWVPTGTNPAQNPGALTEVPTVSSSVDISQPKITTISVPSPSTNREETLVSSTETKAQVAEDASEKSLPKSHCNPATERVQEKVSTAASIPIPSSSLPDSSCSLSDDSPDRPDNPQTEKSLKKTEAASSLKTSPSLKISDVNSFIFNLGIFTDSHKLTIMDQLKTYQDMSIKRWFARSPIKEVKRWKGERSVLRCFLYSLEKDNLVEKNDEVTQKDKAQSPLTCQEQKSFAQNSETTELSRKETLNKENVGTNKTPEQIKCEKTNNTSNVASTSSSTEEDSLTRPEIKQSPDTMKSKMNAMTKIPLSGLLEVVQSQQQDEAMSMFFPNLRPLSNTPDVPQEGPGELHEGSAKEEQDTLESNEAVEHKQQDPLVEESLEPSSPILIIHEQKFDDKYQERPTSEAKQQDSPAIQLSEPSSPILLSRIQKSVDKEQFNLQSEQRDSFAEQLSEPSSPVLVIDIGRLDDECEEEPGSGPEQQDLSASQSLETFSYTLSSKPQGPVNEYKEEHSSQVKQEDSTAEPLTSSSFFYAIDTQESFIDKSSLDVKQELIDDILFVEEYKPDQEWLASCKSEFNGLSVVANDSVTYQCESSCDTIIQEDRIMDEQMVPKMETSQAHELLGSFETSDDIEAYLLEVKDKKVDLNMYSNIIAEDETVDYAACNLIENKESESTLNIFSVWSISQTLYNKMDDSNALSVNQDDQLQVSHEEEDNKELLDIKNLEFIDDEHMP